MKYWMQHGDVKRTIVDSWGNGKEYTALIQSTYSVELTDLDDTYAMGKLLCYGLTKWQKEQTYADKHILVYTPNMYVVGIGTSPQIKQQYKLWKQLGFRYFGGGVFRSDCLNYTTRSIRQLTKDIQ